MEIIQFFIDFVIHLDRHLIEMVSYFGIWTYIILFLIIFLETGLVITPFLPGDSLLFAAGALAAVAQVNQSASQAVSLEIFALLFVFAAAAILGNMSNYGIGYWIGPKIFHKEKVPFLNKEYLTKAHNFYEKYGAITIILARFMPIIRTFVPFVAGIGRMNPAMYTLYTVIGGALWTLFCTLAGFFFGNLEFVKNNFSIVVIAIIVITMIPAVVIFIKTRIDAKKKKAESN